MELVVVVVMVAAAAAAAAIHEDASKSGIVEGFEGATECHIPAFLFFESPESAGYSWVILETFGFEGASGCMNE